MGCICFLNTAIAWGGGEKWHFEVSQYLHSKGHSVLVVAHEKSVLLERLKNSKVPYQKTSISNLSFLNPIKRWQLRLLFKRYEIDTLVLNLSRDVKIAAPTAKSIGVKRIIYRRGSAIPIKNNFFNRYLFRHKLTDILANSIATKKTVLANNPLLFPEDKIRVIYNGIEIPSNIDEFQSKKNPENSEFTIINLGRLEVQKNQKFLVHLSKELKNKGIKFKMIIGGEGRLRKTLEEQINAAGVAKEVELFGFVKEPLKFLSQADVFVLPSLWEGFGYVLAEAALCKKPIIAFDISSNPELVVHKKTGYLVPMNDMNAFAKAVIHIHQNPKISAQMGQMGFKHIVDNFEKKKQLQEIEAYLLNG